MYNITNSTSLDAILVNLANEVNILFPLLLLFEFLVIALGGAFAQQRRTNYSNIPQWFAIGGLVTTTSAFLLLLVDGLVSIATVTTTVVLTALFVLWFLLTGDDGQ